MNYIISTVIVTMFFFSCSRGYYAIDASKHSEFVLQTTNYALNEIVESDLDKMQAVGNVLKFDRRDSQNVTYFRIVFFPKDSIKLKSLLMYGEPTKDIRPTDVTGKPEFLFFSKIDGDVDTVYYKKGSRILINKFRYRAKKVLGYKFYPY